jgi:hypothetical protein
MIAVGRASVCQSDVLGSRSISRSVTVCQSSCSRTMSILPAGSSQYVDQLIWSQLLLPIVVNRSSSVDRSSRFSRSKHQSLSGSADLSVESTGFWYCSILDFAMASFRLTNSLCLPRLFCSGSSGASSTLSIAIAFS